MPLSMFEYPILTQYDDCLLEARFTTLQLLGPRGSGFSVSGSGRGKDSSYHEIFFILRQ